MTAAICRSCDATLSMPRAENAPIKCLLCSGDCIEIATEDEDEFWDIHDRNRFEALEAARRIGANSSSARATSRSQPLRPATSTASATTSTTTPGIPPMRIRITTDEFASDMLTAEEEAESEADDSESSSSESFRPIRIRRRAPGGQRTNSSAPAASTARGNITAQFNRPEPGGFYGNGPFFSYVPTDFPSVETTRPVFATARPSSTTSTVASSNSNTSTNIGTNTNSNTSSTTSTSTNTNSNTSSTTGTSTNTTNSSAFASAIRSIPAERRRRNSIEELDAFNSTTTTVVGPPLCVVVGIGMVSRRRPSGEGEGDLSSSALPSVSDYASGAFNFGSGGLLRNGMILEIARLMSRLSLEYELMSRSPGQFEAMIAALIQDLALGGGRLGGFQAGDFVADDSESMERLLNELFQQATGGSSSGPPGLSTEQLNNLPRRKAAASDNCTCAICQEVLKVEQDEVIVLTPCNHVYHQDCITPWIKRVSSCPICRQPVVLK